MTSLYTRVAAIAVAAVAGSLIFLDGSSIPVYTPMIVAQINDASRAGPVVVGIGDSILEGHGLDQGQSWLAVLASQYGWRLTNLASDGSGFVTVGDNGDTFADQVRAAERLHPDIIVISGSSNDLGSDGASIRDATFATVESIHSALPSTRIIAVSAVWGDTAVPAQLSDITSAVANAVTAVGGTYLDIGQPLSGQPALMQPDDDHPTVTGQLAIASAVAAALLSAHVKV